MNTIEEDDDMGSGVGCQSQSAAPPPTEAVPSDGSSWRDATHLLRDVVGGMTPGKMLYSDSFVMRSAMSAYEILDPKMDPWLGIDKPVTSEDAFASGALPTKLDAAQTVAVMDQLMAQELTWLLGYETVGHTVFTCFYLHFTDKIESGPLQAFARLFLKSLGVEYAIIDRADLFEEEDFLPTRFHFRFGDEFSEEEVIRHVLAIEDAIVSKKIAPYSDMVDRPTAAGSAPTSSNVSAKASPNLNPNDTGYDEAHATNAEGDSDSDNGEGNSKGKRKGSSKSQQQQQQQQQKKNKKNKKKKKKKKSSKQQQQQQQQQQHDSSGSVKALDDDDEIGIVPLEVREWRAVLCRIRFRKAWYELVRALSDERRVSKRSLIASLLERVSELLVGVRLSSDLGRYDAGGRAPGFFPEYGKTLAPSAPPRKYQVCSIENAFDGFEKMIEQLGHIFKLWDIRTGLEEVLGCLSTFSATHDPDILVRSAVFLSLGDEASFMASKLPLSDWIVRSMHEYCPGTLRLTHQPLFASWVPRVVTVLAATVRMYCMNRVRQRQQVQIQMADWLTLQGEAKDCQDGALAADPDASAMPDVLLDWIQDKACSVLLHHQRLGFELGLLSVREYCMTMWAMEILHRLRIRHRSLNGQVVVERNSAEPMQLARTHLVPKRGGVYHAVPESPEAGVERVQLFLCAATKCLITLLVKRGMLACAPFRLTSEDNVFRDRLNLLSWVARLSVVCSYDAYAELHHLEAEALLTKARDDLLLIAKAGKQMLPELEKVAQNSPESILTPQLIAEIKSLCAVARANLMFLLRLKPDDDYTVTLSHDHHAVFPVVVKKNTDD